MTKCAHPNIEITEWQLTAMIHRRNPDGSWWNDSEPGAFTKRVEVYCPDCGMNRVYGYAYRPKWLDELLLSVYNDTGMGSNCRTYGEAGR